MGNSEEKGIQLNAVKDIFSDIKETVTNIRIGTYGLNVAQAHDFIEQFKIASDCKIQISYDMNNLQDDGESGWPLIYKKYGYLQGRAKKGGVYHPKYIIVEYGQDKSKKCRVYISSMNMTKSIYCDTGIVLEGEYSEDQNGNQTSGNSEKNGEGLAKVLKSSYEPEEPTLENKEIEDFEFLKKYSFRLKNDNSDSKVEVSFLSGIEFGKEIFDVLESDELELTENINKKKEIIIFSPFFSEKYVIKMCELENFYFISNRFSADWGKMFKNDKRPQDEFLRHLFYWKETQEQSALHGKLYIFREESQSKSEITLYIGSANFSERALTGKNEELMVKLVFKDDIGKDSIWNRIKKTFEHDEITVKDFESISQNSGGTDYNLTKVEVSIEKPVYYDAREQKWKYNIKISSKPELPEGAKLDIKLYGINDCTKDRTNEESVVLSYKKAINALELVYSYNGNSRSRVIFIEKGDVGEDARDDWERNVEIYVEEMEKQEIAKYLLIKYKNTVSQGKRKPGKELGSSTYKVLLEDSYFEVISRVLEDEQDENKREEYREDILARIRNVSNRKDEIQ